jgi:hypothetical protein
VILLFSRGGCCENGGYRLCPVAVRRLLLLSDSEKRKSPEDGAYRIWMNRCIILAAFLSWTSLPQKDGVFRHICTSFFTYLFKYGGQFTFNIREYFTLQSCK